MYKLMTINEQVLTCTAVTDYTPSSYKHFYWAYIRSGLVFGDGGYLGGKFAFQNRLALYTLFFFIRNSIKDLTEPHCS